MNFMGKFKAKSQGVPSPAVVIKRAFYTMATVGENNAEITMYGDIVKEQPTDWRTGEPVQGQYIVESDFLNDLEAVGNAKTLTLRMNSIGGDAGVSILIHNRLRELAAKGTQLVCIVDGVAMSGGSLIMSACDTVRVNPASLVMVHKCFAFLFGTYNADELRQRADHNDAVDKAQIAVYKRKCGLSETVIAHMMANTTYMTGKEAVDKGFADELLDDAEPLNIAASADRHCLYVNGREMHLTSAITVPDSIPTVNPEVAASVKTNIDTPVASGSEKGGNEPMAKTLEELRKESPELAEQLMAEARATAAPSVSNDAVKDAVKVEQERIRAIDAMAGVVDDETIQAAKYGEHACSAQEMIYQAAQKAAEQNRNFLRNWANDASASGAQDVGASNGGGIPDEGGALTPEQRMVKAKSDVATLLRKNKEV